MFCQFKEVAQNAQELKFQPCSVYSRIFKSLLGEKNVLTKLKVEGKHSVKVLLTPVSTVNRY